MGGQRLHVVAPRDVAAEKLAMPGMASRRLRAELPVDIAIHDEGAFAHQHVDDALADAARAAEHDGRLAG
ncbi:hypothetical protein D3C83_151230 [compost metagenome]